jgi:hypothetical protein
VIDARAQALKAIEKRYRSIEHLLCESECYGRCRECPADVVRDMFTLLASAVPAPPAPNDDPEQGVVMHLLKELKPDCCCGVCEVLREHCEETFAEAVPAPPEKEKAMDEATLNKTLRELTRPSIEAWELFWELDDEQRVQMSKMLASFAAMVVTHHQHRYLRASPVPEAPQQGPVNGHSASCQSQVDGVYPHCTCDPPTRKPDVRGIVEALGFDPTNHHNALKCPYCNPKKAEAPASREQEHP